MVCHCQVYTVCDDPSLLPATVDDKLVHVTSSSRDTSDSSALSAATTINKLQMLHFCTLDKCESGRSVHLLT